MILLHVTYKCKPNRREAFLEWIRTEGIDAACRAESGNIQYAYFIPADGSNDLMLIEKWRDADALALHGIQAHTEKLRSSKAAYVTDTIMEKFTVE